MVGINVGNGGKICCDDLDATESAICQIATATVTFMLFRHCNEKTDRASNVERGKDWSVWAEKGIACQ